MSVVDPDNRRPVDFQLRQQYLEKIKIQIDTDLPNFMKKLLQSPESGEIKQITDDLKFYQEIAISPKGDKIAFHGKREGKDHIYIMDIDG